LGLFCLVAGQARLLRGPYLGVGTISAKTETEEDGMKKRTLSVAALATMISSAALGCSGQTDATANTSAVDEAGALSNSTAATSAAAAQTPTTAAAGYADGTYTGESVRIRWGEVQVQAVIENGALTEIAWLALPTDRESDRINNQATPILAQEAIESQSAEVDVISGATMTSEAFMESLDSALEQAS